MWEPAKSSTERSQALRAKRRQRGLKYLSFWVHPDDEKLARDIMASFQSVALAEESAEREKQRAEVFPYYFSEWKQWLNHKFTEKPQRVSSEKQRRTAYQLARALSCQMPDDATFSDYYLLKDWIRKKQDSPHSGIVKQFIQDQEKTTAEE